jgi:hypothetical protein
MEKLGAIFKKFKAAFNISAPAQGSATSPSLMGADMKMRNALARYTGVQIPDLGGKTYWNIDYCLESWKGIVTEVGVQYFDSKTRHFGNLSRTKLLDVAEELLPMVMAHEDAKDSPTYLTDFARQYHKYTQGYDMHDGRWGGWNFDYMKPYATIKAVRAIGNKTGLIPKINKHLPKGVNL